MEFLPHQILKSDLAYEKLKKNKIVLIQGKPRSGKTATALRVASISKVDNWLILCPKNAISGWELFIKDKELNLQGNFTIISYQQIMKRVKDKYKLKVDPKDYKALILDESHNFGTLGRPSNRIKMTRLLCYNYPTILLSGTAIVESACSIYHQCYITKYSPFKFPNFYKFHKEWGKPYYIKAGGRDINQYDKYKPELLDEIHKLSIYMTQEDAGIHTTVKDKLHYVELSKSTKSMYNTLLKDKVYDIQGETLVLDSVMKERTSLHMLESGIIKIEDKIIFTGATEKIDYIKRNFEDEETTGIMAHFIGERELLKKYFKKASIFSSTAHAEGVDLSYLYNFIIFSSGYSGAKFIQRRDRITNVKGSNTNIVHHILVKGGISEQVYKTTSKKLNFNDKMYKRTEL